MSNKVIKEYLRCLYKGSKPTLAKLDFIMGNPNLTKVTNDRDFKEVPFQDYQY